MNLSLPIRSFIFCLLPFSVAAHDFKPEVPVDKNDPEVVFAYQGDAVLTQDGIDAAFEKIPEKDRPLFIRDGQKVDHLVRNLMKTKVIALDAIDNGFDENPEVMQRMVQAAYRELASAWIEELADRAPEADYEAMAYEDYLANPEDYRSPEYRDVSHILIGIRDRSEADALALANTVKQEIIDGQKTFAELVAEYSDDPSKDSNKGSFKRVSPGQTAKPFEDAAFALEEEGELSEPVLTEYGYHIIRLDKVYPSRQLEFAEVKEEAVQTKQKKHESEYQENYIKGLLEEGIVLPEGSVEVMLKRHFGDNLENAPQF